MRRSLQRGWYIRLYHSPKDCRRPREAVTKGSGIGAEIAENRIATLCTYPVKHADMKKRWSSSHNLKGPSSRVSDGKYNRWQIKKWVKERPGNVFGEKKYPGWPLTGDDYGVQYEYNEQTGWPIYLKLMKLITISPEVDPETGNIDIYQVAGK